MSIKLSRMAALAGVMLLSAPATAGAFAHLWAVKEIFSNYNGSVQFIELVSNGPSETFVQGVPIRATSDGALQTFNVPSNLAGTTSGRHLLFATPGFATLTGAVTPNFTIPANFFDPEASTIVIDWGGFNQVTISGSILPINGVLSLTDQITTATPGQNLAAGTNSPTNFGGSVGSVSVPIPGDTNLDGIVDITDLGTLATNWQMPGSRAQGDFDGSGFIDITDLGLLASNWQEGVAAAAPRSDLAAALSSVQLPARVPEPSAAMLVAAGLALASTRRKRRKKMATEM
jgi:hypothetical protein